ncbi:MAG: pirin [Acidimicrobiaceae bacterium]|nr:pirin [Acidimicrobiaceae bacterium]
MPAVTVDDLLVLPRIKRPDQALSTERSVRSVTAAPSGFEGDGFPVRRAFAGVASEDLDPFIHMDQMGEVDYAPGEPKGTPWHPHRGFETVTYMIDGTFRHQDSIGGGGVITDGDTQWMTAGAGILHIETPPEELVLSGGRFHGIQLWVNLPAASKWEPPRYQDIGRSNVALVSSHDGGALLRIVAGAVGGFGGPGATHTPMTFVHATVEPGARLEVPWPSDHNALVYVLAGKGSVGSAGQPISSGRLAVLGAGDHIVVTADEAQDSHTPKFEVILLGGKPIGEPVAWYGPFVMNTEEELRQAFDDYQHGRLGKIPAEHIGS